MSDSSLESIDIYDEVTGKLDEDIRTRNKQLSQLQETNKSAKHLDSNVSNLIDVSKQYKEKIEELHNELKHRASIPEANRKISNNEITNLISKIHASIKKTDDGIGQIIQEVLHVIRDDSSSDGSWQIQGEPRAIGGAKLNSQWRYKTHQKLFGGYSKKMLIGKAENWGIKNPKKYGKKDLQIAMKVLMHNKYGDISKREYLNHIANIVGIKSNNYKRKSNLLKAINTKTKNILL